MSLKKQEKQKIKKDLGKIVALGGGHGLGRLLSALAFMEQNLTGIVTTTDDGGSTGRLRNETGCIAWGDLRNCLSQLATGKDLKNTLFNFRFDDHSSLNGHSLGNLMLLALDNLCVRPTDTINLFRDFLNVKAHIFPMSEEPAYLSACDSQGCKILGEVNIDAQDELPTLMEVVPDIVAPEGVINAITDADLIIMGPGSFLTSVIPPLLMPDIKHAIVNANSPRILIANMVPENGPTGKMRLCDKINWMENVVDKHIIDAIIWPESRELHGPGNLNIIKTDLKTSDHERLHDRIKLVNAIHKLVSNL